MIRKLRIWRRKIRIALFVLRHGSRYGKSLFAGKRSLSTVEMLLYSDNIAYSWPDDKEIQGIMKQKYQLQTANGGFILESEMLRTNPPYDIVIYHHSGAKRLYRHFGQNVHGGSDVLVYREATSWEHRDQS